MKEALRNLGLTDGEISVYLALLKLGTVTNSPIAKESQLQSSTVYYCLNSLVKKGFATYILKGNRKHFSAVDPEVIPEILDEKQKQLDLQKKEIQQIVKTLHQYKRSSEEQTTAEVFEGFRGFQMIFRSILKQSRRGDYYEAFAYEQKTTESPAIKLLFMQHNQKLKRKGVKLRLIASLSMKNALLDIYGKQFLQNFQEIRYTQTVIPVGITLFKDTVITHIPENEKIISIKVKNHKLATMYRDYFNFVWKSTED